MILPIRTDSPLRSTPWMNWLLIALNVLAFLAQRRFPQLAEQFALNAAYPRVYQFVTYAFLHADIWHIVGNMLFLYIFGNNVCDRFGNFGYLGLYLGGAVCAALGYTLINDHSMLGASGAVSAVTGAYLALLPRSRITVAYWFIIIGVTEVPSIFFIIFYFMQDLILAYSGVGGGVAHEAHVAGSVMGFVLSLTLQATRLLPRDPMDMMSLLERMKRRHQFGSMVRGGYDPFSIDPGKARAAAAAKLPTPVQELRAQIAEAVAHRRIGDAAKSFVELRKMDPAQTLPRQTLLEIANELFSQQDPVHAADAYELYLTQYGSSQDVDHVNLMLGLTYSRYLNRIERAKECLREAIRLARSDRERQVAEAELQRLAPPT